MICCIANWKITIEMMWIFPSKDGGSFHSYVSFYQRVYLIDSKNDGMTHEFYISLIMTMNISRMMYMTGYGICSGLCTWIYRGIYGMCHGFGFMGCVEDMFVS